MIDNLAFYTPFLGDRWMGGGEGGVVMRSVS